MLELNLESFSDQCGNLLGTRLDDTLERFRVTAEKGVINSYQQRGLSGVNVVPDDSRSTLMHRCNRHPIHNLFLDIENSECLRNAREKRCLGEIHPRANTTPITKANLARVTLCWFVCSRYVARWIKNKRIGINVWVMQHVPKRWLVRYHHIQEHSKASFNQRYEWIISHLYTMTKNGVLCTHHRLAKISEFLGIK